MGGALSDPTAIGCDVIRTRETELGWGALANSQQYRSHILEGRRRTEQMTRYKDYRRDMPTVVDRYPTLVPMLDALRVDHDRHFDVVASILGPNGPGVDAPFFEVDIVLVSVLNRSLDLLDGFVDTFERWNISSAAPLVRLQVDNLLRLNLLTVAPPGSVTPLLLSGEPLRKADDPLSKGKKTKLTDHRLRQLAAENFPWLDQVYERASGWVHFSSVHIGVTLRIDDAGVMEG